jgi:hypothetical protein
VYNKAIGKNDAADAQLSADGKRVDALGSECTM